MPALQVKTWLESRPRRSRSHKCVFHDYAKNLKCWGEHPPEAAKRIFTVGSLQDQYHTAIKKWALSVDVEIVPRFVREWCHAPIADEFSSAIKDLRDVVTAINESRLLPQASPEMNQLLRRAVQARNMPQPNIEEWANRLLADTGDLTD